MSEPNQPEARARVLAALQAAGPKGIGSSDLCDRAHTHAAVRRVWELSQFYGYRIVGAKLQRNCWHWTLVCAEPWARDVSVSVREARAAEKSRLEAPVAVAWPIQPQPSLLALMQEAS